MRVLRRTRRSARNASQPSVDLAGEFAVLGLGPGADEALIEIAYRCEVERLADLADTDPPPQDRRRRLDDAVVALRAAIDSEISPRARWVGQNPSDPYELLHLHRSASQALVTAAYPHGLRSALTAQDVDRAAALEWAYSRIGTAEARTAHDRRPPKRWQGGHRAPAGPRRTAGASDRAVSTPMRSPVRMGGLRGILTRLVGRPACPAVPSPDPAPVDVREGSVPVVARPVHALAITLGGQAVETVELRDGAAYVIGSAASCDIPLVPSLLDGAGEIAPEHARIAAGVGGVSFRQIAEQAHTLVNGRPARWMLLESGDELQIGPYHCRYQIARFEADAWRVAAWS